MTPKIRTALLGYGLAGSVFHAPSLELLEQFSLDVIVTSDPERQAAARAAHPHATVMSRSEWSGSRSDIDLVIVATPPESHGALAAAALQGGCAVVVDKPFALSSAEGEALLALAKEHGQLLTVYQNRRWDGEYLTLQKLLAEGALGEVRRFESRLERWQPEITKEWKAQATVETGGGLLFDLGTHLIDQALQLFGPVEHVYGELAARRATERSEDDVFVALRHVSGVTSHLWANACAAHNAPRFRVLGSEAAYVKQEADVQESQIRNGILPGQAGYGIDPMASWGRVGRGEDTKPVATEAGNFSCFYELLSAAILDGAPVPVDPADAIAGLRIVEQIRALQ